MKTYSYLVVAIILTLIIVLESEASRNRRSSCRSINQCRKTGKCIRKPNYFCGLGNLLFGRKKTCHHYECAECTKNYHCSGNQYCSGYTCVQQVYHDNQDYTTQNWNKKNSAWENYNYDSNYKYSQIDDYFTTPKSYVSKYDTQYDTSKWENYNYDSNYKYGQIDDYFTTPKSYVSKYDNLFDTSKYDSYLQYTPNWQAAPPNPFS